MKTKNVLRLFIFSVTVSLVSTNIFAQESLEESIPPYGCCGLIPSVDSEHPMPTQTRTQAVSQTKSKPLYGCCFIIPAAITENDNASTQPITGDTNPEALKTLAKKQLRNSIINGLINSTAMAASTVITIAGVPYALSQGSTNLLALICALDVATGAGISVVEALGIAESCHNKYCVVGALGNLGSGIKNWIAARKLKRGIAATQEASQNPV